MKIFTTPAEVSAFSRQCRREGNRIALVPTLGCLHDGHFSLIDIAKKHADVVIVSIFVNPTQFGPNEDLAKYPRTFEADCRGCEAHGAAAIFAPVPESMYHPDSSVWVVEETLSNHLCGLSRPVHFRGVCTVVAKLFNIALPDVAVFGQKDAQQALIIRRMVRDLNYGIEIITAPLIRDSDNVALSSRNKYLSEDERIRARSLSRAVLALEECPLDQIAARVEAGKKEIIAAGGKIDYFEIVDTDTLEPPTAETREILAAAAVYYGSTRLIDNTIVRFK